MSKIISVWGSPGSGKSLISLLTANEIAYKKQNVCLISFDKTTPMLPVYLPFTELKRDNSLAKLLSNNITTDNLIGKIHTHKDNKYLSFLALAAGDNQQRYPDNFLNNKLERLIEVIKILDVDYIILDLTSNFISDSSSLWGLKNSDKILSIINPDTSSLAFIDNYNTLLKDIDNNKILQVINKTTEYTPHKKIMEERSYQYTVPLSRALYEQYMCGKFTPSKTTYHFINEVIL